MIRITIGLCLILFVVAVISTVLTPRTPPYKVEKVPPTEVKGYWQKFQTTPQPRVGRNYWLDNPTEAWHEADENDDSDDPELYNDKYDGK